MFIDLEAVTIYLRPGATDMRKSMNGLSVIVDESLEMNALSGSLFVFCSRNRKVLKALYWDGTGFWIFMKRLEKPYRFPWPKDGTEARNISSDQLKMLLSGINFWEAHTRLHYRSVV